MNSPIHNLASREAQVVQCVSDAKRGPLSLEELAADLDEVEPTDLEIIDALVFEFPLTRTQAIERLRRFDFAAFPRVPA